MKLSLAVPFVVVALGVGGGVFHALNSQAVSPPTEPAPSATQAGLLPAVSVVKVTSADFTETVLITGSIVARDEILIHPEIEGFRIEQFLAEEGDIVNKGQVLARLATETLDAQLAQSDANIARAEAAIAVARSGIVQADATVKEANSAFDRAKPLKQSGYLSGATFDQRELAAATADSKLISARDSLRSAEADKVALEAQRRELAWKRGKTEITSPVDGVISRRTARVGAVASALNDPLFRIIARGDVELDAEVAESDLGKVIVGQHATVTSPGVPEVAGRVRLISSEVDKTTRLGRVRVFIGTNPLLRLGAFGRGTIETAKSHGLKVPTSAVVYVTQGGREISKVQVVSDGRVSDRVVKVGLKTQTALEVREGLAEGDTIVAKSGSFLRDGDAVRPIMLEATTVSSTASSEAGR